MISDWITSFSMWQTLIAASTATTVPSLPREGAAAVLLPPRRLGVLASIAMSCAVGVGRQNWDEGNTNCKHSFAERRDALFGRAGAEAANQGVRRGEGHRRLIARLVEQELPAERSVDAVHYELVCSLGYAVEFVGTGEA